MVSLLNFSGQEPGREEEEAPEGASHAAALGAGLRHDGALQPGQDFARRLSGPADRQAGQLGLQRSGYD